MVTPVCASPLVARVNVTRGEGSFSEAPVLTDDSWLGIEAGYSSAGVCSVRVFVSAVRTGVMGKSVMDGHGAFLAGNVAMGKWVGGGVLGLCFV